MPTALRALAFSLLAATLGLAEEPTALNLTFAGNGTVVTTQTTFTNTYNRQTHKFESGVTTNTERKEFYGSGFVEIQAAHARIKLPRDLIPLIGTSADGWFPIRHLQVNDQEISGTVRISGQNKPKFHIDRVSGAIAITGEQGEFNGQCELIPDDAHQRKF